MKVKFYETKYLIILYAAFLDVNLFCFFVLISNSCWKVPLKMVISLVQHTSEPLYWEK